MNNDLKVRLDEQRRERIEEQEAALIRATTPRPIILCIGDSEKHYLLPAGYEINEDKELWKLDRYGHYHKRITPTPMFIIEYITVTESEPWVMARVAFLSFEGWKVVMMNMPYGISPGFVFSLADYGLMVHDYTKKPASDFLREFAELNKNAIPVTIVEKVPIRTCEFVGGGRN